MRILVTGSNLYDNHRSVFLWLEAIVRVAGGEIVTVVHDGELGAQVIAAQIAEASEDAGLENECHPKATAQELVDLGADECVYFLQKGFDDTRARELADCARAAGILTLGYSNYSRDH